MRVVLPMLLLAAGCIASEPGKDTHSAAERKACTDLEGLTFQSSGESSQSVAFVADDAEYSTYTVQNGDGTQQIGLAQCITAGTANIIYIDGATDYWSARADVPSLQWTNGQTLVVAPVL